MRSPRHVRRLLLLALAVIATAAGCATPTPSPTVSAPTVAPSDTSAPTPSAGPSPTAAPTEPPSLSERPFTVLVLGGDNDFRTDAVMVVGVDPVARTLAMASIPRDTINVPLPGGGTFTNQKINAFYDYAAAHPDIYPQGPGRATADMVGVTLGIKIDFYAATSFQGFTNIVDAFGGVTVNLPKAVVDPVYQVSTYVIGIRFPKGKQLLKGPAVADLRPHPEGRQRLRAGSPAAALPDRGRPAAARQAVPARRPDGSQQEPRHGLPAPRGSRADQRHRLDRQRLHPAGGSRADRLRDDGQLSVRVRAGAEAARDAQAGGHSTSPGPSLRSRGGRATEGRRDPDRHRRRSPRVAAPNLVPNTVVAASVSESRTRTVRGEPADREQDPAADQWSHQRPVAGEQHHEHQDEGQQECVEHLRREHDPDQGQASES